MVIDLKIASEMWKGVESLEERHVLSWIALSLLGNEKREWEVIKGQSCFVEAIDVAKKA